MHCLCAGVSQSSSNPKDYCIPIFQRGNQRRWEVKSLLKSLLAMGRFWVWMQIWFPSSCSVQSALLPPYAAGLLDFDMGPVETALQLLRLLKSYEGCMLILGVARCFHTLGADDKLSVALCQLFQGAECETFNPKSFRGRPIWKQLSRCYKPLRPAVARLLSRWWVEDPPPYVEDVPQGLRAGKFVTTGLHPPLEWLSGPYVLKTEGVWWLPGNLCAEEWMSPFLMIPSAYPESGVGE